MFLPRSARELLEDLLDGLYPLRCRLCGEAAVDALACAEHALPARLPGPRCRRCARRLAAALPHGSICAWCRRTPPAFRATVVLSDYAEGLPAREWVLALKHGGRRDLARPLGALLAERVRERPSGHSPGALLIPVPLHPLRALERGYDQALLLARAMGEAAGLEAVPALARRRWTVPQGGPGAVSRRANVRHAFVGKRRAARRVAGRETWLVDDVVTSGATAQECARVLRVKGAASVGVAAIALARGDGRSDGPEGGLAAGADP